MRGLALLSLFVCIVRCNHQEGRSYWQQLGDAELKEALSQPKFPGNAKNVIIFVGDGMSPDTVAASRIYSKGERGYLSWERFPHVGLLKTYNTDRKVPDSASAATALFCGVKTNYDVFGVDANVPLDDCEASLRTDNRVDSIIDWAQVAGKSTGFVTTTRVTHATPAPLYAHGPNRRWESDGSIKPKEAREKCKDIARQLVEDIPGRNIQVIMGGGRQMFNRDVSGTEDDPIDTWAGRRNDSRNLIDVWMQDKRRRNVSFSVVQNNAELARVDLRKTDFLLGIFANGHLSMDYKRNKGPNGMPSLKDMTVSALKILRKDSNGFLLMVEGGLIDFAHHRGHAAQALDETVRFSEAVSAAMKLIDVRETLVIVTSDHTHSMTFNGNAKREGDILGIAQEDRNNIPYTILTYSTGGENNIAYEAFNNTAKRIDPTFQNTTAFEYSQQAAIISDEAHHGGGDVAVYAIGPYAHLFHTTHEQNFVANVIAYAAKIGPYRTNSTNGLHKQGSQWIIIIQGCIFCLVTTLYIFWHIR